MDALTRREFLERSMAESVPVRCPACRREHLYEAPSYPCVCGSPVSAPLDRLAEATTVAHRAWDDEWTTVRCDACGRETQWPHPELGCACGTTLRIPLRTAPGGQPGPGTHQDPAGTPPRDSHPDRPRQAGTDTRRDPNHNLEPGPPEDNHPDPNPQAGTGTPRDANQDSEPGPPEDNRPGVNRKAEGGAPRDGEGDAPTGGGAEREREATAGVPLDGYAPDEAGSERLGGGRPGPEGGHGRRPEFRPVTIRTARDAVTAAALYLGWLGYRDIRRADQRPPSGIGLAARGILAQVDPTVRPASLRDVECLWLTAMTESSDCVFFSLAGYADDARARADTLGVPLFVLDLTGTPQPVNSPADELIAVTD